MRSKLLWRYFALVFCTLILILGLQPAEARATAQTSRLYGSDRFLTAIDVSKTGWPDGSDTVILTNGMDYPDALSAAPLAKKYQAPILLTKKDKLYSDTAVELKRLKAKKVILVGGDGVLSTNVLYELRVMGLEVTRIAGQNRYDTSLAVAEEVGLSNGVFVLSGSRFQDALAVSAIAASQGMPLLLVPEGDLTVKQQSVLAKNKVSKGIFVGAEADFSQKVIDYFLEYENIRGDDPYDRNVNLVKYFEKGLDLNTVYVATGRDFPDALAASALAAKGNNPLFLTNGNSVPSVVRNYFSDQVITRIKILGDVGVINNTTRNELANLPASFNTYKHFTATIKEKQIYQLPKTVTMKLSTGEWEEVPVTWGLAYVSTQRAGTYEYEGTVEGYGSVYLTLVVEPIPSKVGTVTAEVVKGDSYYFPQSLPVIMSDDSVEQYPVTWSSNVVTMNKVGTYTFQGAIEGTTQKAIVTLKVSEDSAITFADAGLEQAVRDAIRNKSASQPVYKKEILRITSLDARGYGITDLKGLEGFTNLEYLDCANNNLVTSGLTPIQRLTNLRRLDLEDNAIEQITAVQNLVNLTYLDVSGNLIESFTPLKNLTRLRTLYLSGNATQDYSPLRQIYNSLSSEDFRL